MAFATIDVTKGITGTIPVANGGTGLTSGTSGQFLKFTGSTTVASSAVDAGKVLQVLSSTKTDTFTTTSGTKVDITGLSVAITPSSSSNKVLVHSSINFNNAAGEGFKGYLVRGSTDIGVSTAASSSTATFPLGTMANTNNYWLNTTGGFVLDTPSTTSATTYKIQMEVLSTTYTIFINKPARNTSGDVAVPSFITLFEVAA